MRDTQQGMPFTTSRHRTTASARSTVRSPRSAPASRKPRRAHTRLRLAPLPLPRRTQHLHGPYRRIRKVGTKTVTPHESAPPEDRAVTRPLFR